MFSALITAGLLNVESTHGSAAYRDGPACRRPCTIPRNSAHEGGAQLLAAAAQLQEWEQQDVVIVIGSSPLPACTRIVSREDRVQRVRRSKAPTGPPGPARAGAAEGTCLQGSSHCCPGGCCCQLHTRAGSLRGTSRVGAVLQMVMKILGVCKSVGGKGKARPCRCIAAVVEQRP